MSFIRFLSAKFIPPVIFCSVRSSLFSYQVLVPLHKPSHYSSAGGSVVNTAISERYNWGCAGHGSQSETRVGIHFTRPNTAFCIGYRTVGVGSKYSTCPPAALPPRAGQTANRGTSAETRYCCWLFAPDASSRLNRRPVNEVSELPPHHYFLLWMHLDSQLRYQKMLLTS